MRILKTLHAEPRRCAPGCWKNSETLVSKGTLSITVLRRRWMSQPSISFTLQKLTKERFSGDLWRLSCNHRIALAIPSFCTKEETKLFAFFSLKSLNYKALSPSSIRISLDNEKYWLCSWRNSVFGIFIHSLRHAVKCRIWKLGGTWVIPKKSFINSLFL